MNIDWGQVALILAAAIPSVIIGRWAHVRAKKVDAISEQSGIATSTHAGTAQAIQGLKDLIEDLQEDNQSFRDDNRSFKGEIRELATQLEVCNSEAALVREERSALRTEVARYKRQYGELNGPTGGKPS